MSLRLVAGVLSVALFVAACNDDVGDGEPILEPQGSLGERVVYRGGLGTEAEWELTVVVEDLACDIEIGDDTDVALGDERFCAVAIRVENTGVEPNVEEFSQASTLITDTDEIGVVAPDASETYREENDLDPLIGVLPGETADSALVFSLPAEEEPTHLHLQAGTDDDFVVIDLRG
jgi:hypothetical protein